MITADFHVHTQFSDGRDAIGAVAARAYVSGMTALGFSEHVYAPYDLEVCMRPGTAPAYREACRRLREEKQERYPACRHERGVITEPDIGWLEEFERQPGYRILLCHHPEYYPRFLKGRDIDLILSGHAHGGQWRIGRQGIFAPSQGLFPRLTEGVHDGRLVISRGLANRTPVPRLNNPPEIVYIQN